MSVVNDAAAAPKTAVNFAKNNVLALVFLALLLMVVFVAVETRRPGQVRGFVARIPLLGGWATGAGS